MKKDYKFTSECSVASSVVKTSELMWSVPEAEKKLKEADKIIKEQRKLIIKLYGLLLKSNSFV